LASDSARSLNSPLLFKGSLVDPRLRASNEHIPIVRVPGAQDQRGCPSNSFHRAPLLPHSLEGGLDGLPLRVSNEGLLRPRVARAQETV